MSRFTDEMFRRIEKIVELDQRVIVSFRSYTKTPLLGHFVQLDDHEDLKSKGYTRFVTEGKAELFGCANDLLQKHYTTMFVVETILHIKYAEEKIC